MRTIHFALLAVAVAGLAACGKSKSNSTNAVPVPQQEGRGPDHPMPNPGRSGVPEYEFRGTNSRGAKCTTGLRKFESMNLMCLNLQDPLGNNDCEQAERFKRFNRECRSLGMDLLESRQCRVTLLKPIARISEGGRFDDEMVLASTRYCVGYMQDGSPADRLDQNGVVLYRDVRLDLSMNFVARQKVSKDRGSQMVIRLSKGEGKRATSLTEEIRWDSSKPDGFYQGTTRDGAYKYAISCDDTWACSQQISKKRIGGR